MHKHSALWMNLCLSSLMIAVSLVAATSMPISAAPNSAIAQTKPGAAKSAASNAFVAVQSPTQGNVRFVTENGKQYLELDRTFSTKEAPDLYVLLHRSQKPTTYKQGEYINLGKLQNLKGTQRYAIPASVKLADYHSVVIWCRKLNATMGYAALSGGGTTKPNPCASKSNSGAAKSHPCASKSNPGTTKPKQ